MKRRKLIATLAFTIALILAAAEVFLLFFAKDNHDYAVAREQSETLTVELGLISASFTSGNKTLYKEGMTRFDQTLSDYRTNDYMRWRRADVLQSLDQYKRTLNENSDKIDTLLELRASLTAVTSELHNLDHSTLDSAGFYRVAHTLEDLNLALENIELDEFKDVRDVIGNFAYDVRGVIDTAATCVAVCSDSVFDEKAGELNAIRDKYNEQFKTLGLDFSKELNTSELINTLRAI